MKFKVKYLQEGGQMAPDPSQGGAPGGAPDASQGGAPGGDQGGQPAPAGAEGGGQDPLMQIAQMFATALQSQDCAALSQGAQMFLQLISQAQGGGGAQGAPPTEQPVYKSGGKFGKIQLKGKKPIAKGTEESVEEAKKGGKMKIGAKC